MARSEADASLPGLSRPSNQRARVWRLARLVIPWLLLAISTIVYLAWLPNSGDTPAKTATVLGMVSLSALWVVFGYTLPIRRGTPRPAQSAVYFLGLLVLCTLLMLSHDIFLIFTITGFFHAYLLRPWQAGIAGVLATSLILNGVTMQIWATRSAENIAFFILIVMVQSAAIGAGIFISVRGEAEEQAREKLVDRLETALHENAALHAELVVQARESGAHDERQRLAREIHDTLAQGLTGIITQLQAAQAVGPGGERYADHLERALQLARSSLTEARRSVRALGPQELGEARLPEALETLTRRWAKESGTRVQMEVTGARTPLSPAIEVALFRVAQEALTNIAKHADAARVGITLSYAGPEVLLDVRDDGRGFTGSHGAGFGLTSIRQRIRGVGGHVEFESAPGEGVALSARVPAITPGATVTSSSEAVMKEMSQ